jgi:isoleucyl-tRNA synthetase
MTVVLDIRLTPELIEEGFVREVISKVQTMRKEAGFEVMDKIVLYENGNQRIEEVLKNNRDSIMKDVLAEDIITGSAEGYVKEWSINDEKVTLGVKKI